MNPESASTLHHTDKGLIGASLGAGWRACVAHWGSLAIASAVVLLASAPIQWFSWIVGVSLERIARIGEDITRAGTPPTAGQTEALIEPLGSCCGGTCGNLVFSIVLLAPAVAGATMLGAQAAAGNPQLGTVFVGFRRYWATVCVGTLCLLLGGGVAVIAGAVASVGARMGVVAAGELTGEVIGSGAENAVWVLAAIAVAGMLWLSARLWLALYRLVDPSRPPVRAKESLRWSWQRTAGATQWRICGLMLVLGVVAGVMQAPGEWLAAGGTPQRLLAGWAISLALAVGAWLPWVLACSGAVYERLAPPR